MIKIDIKKKLNGSFGDMELNINIDIKNGDFLAISGKSGSGKTTFLRVLAGLEDAAGNIIVDDNIWQNEKEIISTQKREIGFVFQDYALFPNMSVIENLLFTNNDIKLANRLLEMVELENLSNRYPHSLSGGQKQRVSLVRAMMNRPKLLLMDEPLSALDPYMRDKLQNKIAELHKEFNTTTIMVSHNQSEIYRLANRVIEIDNGKIVYDIGVNELIKKEKKRKVFKVDAEILDMTLYENIYKATLYSHNQIFDIDITKEQYEKFELGDRLNLELLLDGLKIVPDSR